MILEEQPLRLQDAIIHRFLTSTQTVGNYKGEVFSEQVTALRSVKSFLHWKNKKQKATD